MTQQFRFLTDSTAKGASPSIELALALGLAMQKREETGIPFVRRAAEIPTVAARITWPILMRRAFAPDRVLFFDMVGSLGDRMTIPVNPAFGISDDMMQLHEDDTFSSDLLRLAEGYAGIQPLSVDSNLLTLFAGLGDAVQQDRNLLHNDSWGTSLPVSEQQIEQVRREEEKLLSWLPHFNEEEAKLDQVLKALKEIGNRRLEYYEAQKTKALQLLNEEINTLEPQVNQQLGDLRQQYELLQQQKSSIQQRTADMEEQIVQLQSEQQRYQGRSQQMSQFYGERVRRLREEIRYLSEQEAQSDEDAMEELSARSLLLKRPLSVLEQQRQQAERQWQQAIATERELIKTLTDILQEARLSLQMAAKELLNRSQMIGLGYPEEMYLELPFFIVRLQSVTTSRYIVMPPGQLRSANQLSAFFTDLLRGVRLPWSSRGATWDEMAKLIEDRLNRQQLPDWFYTLLNESNVLLNDACWQQVDEGLGELRSGAYLTEKMVEQLKQQFAEIREALKIPQPLENPPEAPPEE